MKSFIVAQGQQAPTDHYFERTPPSSETADRPSADAAAIRGLVLHSILGQDSPICQIEIHKNDVVVRKKVSSVRTAVRNAQRGEITEHSLKSRLALSHFLNNTDHTFHSMLTLTFPAQFPTDGRKVKKCFHDFARNTLCRLEKKRLPLVWFLEFQRRGAPHFHVLWARELPDPEFIPRTSVRSSRLGYWTDRSLQSKLALQWALAVARFFGDGTPDPDHLRAGLALEILDDETSAKRYACAHAAKVTQKTVPACYSGVGRFWGKYCCEKLPPPLVINATTESVFAAVGRDALSTNGRVRKFLWGASRFFSTSDEEFIF